jgi:hypothetical protein
MQKETMKSNEECCPHTINMVFVFIHFKWTTPLHPYLWSWCCLSCVLVFHTLLWCIHAPLHMSMLCREEWQEAMKSVTPTITMLWVQMG